MNKNDAPMVLIEPLPIEWEIDPGFDNLATCSPRGTIKECEMGNG